MRNERIWPTGARDLRTDAFGLVLRVSLHRSSGAVEHLDEACSLVTAVERELRLEADPIPDVAMWIFALGRLARFEPGYRLHALELARGLHARLAADGQAAGSNLHPFYLDVACRSLEGAELGAQVADLRARIESSYRDLVITRDLDLGTMLWMTHFHADEPWARLHWGRCQRVLELLWVDPPGYFGRGPGATRTRSAVANHAISIGLQSVGATPERVEKLRQYFSVSRAMDSEDRPATAHILACCADLPGELLMMR
jgi:hypothetical protein